MKLIQAITVILLGSSTTSAEDQNTTTSFSTTPISSITTPFADATENLFDTQVVPTSTAANAADESLLDATNVLEELVNATGNILETVNPANDTGYNDWLDNIAGHDIQDGMNHTDNGTATDTWFADQEGTEWANVASDDVPTEEVPSDDVPSAASRIVSASVLAVYTAFAIMFL